MNNNRAFVSLRVTALLALIVGALGSIYFVMNAGRNNNSFILKGLFLIWILLPFIALAITEAIAKHWSVVGRKTIYWLMIIVTIGSLCGYSGIIHMPNAKNAFIFLVTPLLSLILLLIVILIIRKHTRS